MKLDQKYIGNIITTIFTNNNFNVFGWINSRSAKKNGANPFPGRIHETRYAIGAQSDGYVDKFQWIRAGNLSRGRL